jgi:4-amino-4-deoxy-L-arabinose transferase-like glycosyltransferase
MSLIATGETTNTGVLVGRLERERVVAWLAPAFPIAVAAMLNLWNLAQNGYSNLYYSVAVQSMMQSFHNFFFASYDAGGYISVDKPPVALWIQTISAKIFGFNSLSLLVPEALAGVAAVAVMYFLVKRLFGTFAGFVAALALAVTPIAVAVERTNNTDTWLMLATLLAAWAISRATEKGQFKLLALGLATVGVAFNIKMLAAFIILPVFYLLYMVAAPIKWHKRLLHLTLGSVVLFAVALSWPMAVDLTPASQRPWVGGSQANNVLDLALNYNGLGRVTGNEGVGGPGGGFGGGRGFGGGGGAPRGFPNLGNPGNQSNPGGSGNPGNGFPRRGFNPGAGNGQSSSQSQSQGGILGFLGSLFGNIFGNSGSQAGRGFGGGGGMFGAGFAGPLRLFTGGQLAEQWSWLFPMALFGLLAAVLALKRKWPLEFRGQALILWTGWLLMYGAVFSAAEGIFHPYYLIMLAPPAAALTGIGINALWKAYRKGGWKAWLLPIALLATAWWQGRVLAQYPQWAAVLAPILIAAALVAAVPLLGLRPLPVRLRTRLAPGLVSVGMLGLLVAPLVWSVTPAMASPNNASLPLAGPSAISDNSSTWTRLDSPNNSALVSYLEANRDGYFYLVAVPNSQEASSIALETGQPVLAMGGFMGSDPAMTVQRLQEMIADGQVGFVMGGSSQAINQWVQSTCSAVDPSLYGGSSGFGGGFGRGFMGGQSQLYDCPAQ